MRVCVRVYFVHSFKYTCRNDDVQAIELWFMYVCVHIYVCVYIYMCVCVCVYIYIYI
jgi:hypothetical protein